MLVCLYSRSFWNYWMTRELVYLYQTWTVVHTGTCIHMVWLSLQLVLEKKVKHSTPLHCCEGEWHKDCVSLVGGAVLALVWTSFKKQSPWSSQSHSASHTSTSTASPIWTLWDSHTIPTSKSCRTGTQPTPSTSTWDTCLRQIRRDSASSGIVSYQINLRLI